MHKELLTGKRNQAHESVRSPPTIQWEVAEALSKGSVRQRLKPMKCKDITPENQQAVPTTHA